MALVPKIGDVIAHVAEGDADDVDQVVSVAWKAFNEGPSPKATVGCNFGRLRGYIFWRS